MLRLCLSGEPVSFAGDHFTIRKFRLGAELGARRPKIVLGALNERMFQLGGAEADGVLLNYLPASQVPWWNPPCEPLATASTVDRRARAI